MNYKGESEHFYRHMGVYGICVVDGSLLVIQKILGPYTGKFDLPGGRLEDFETLEQGIHREMKEETGYELKSLSQIGVCDFSVIYRLKSSEIEQLHHIAILYEVKLADKKRTNIEAFDGQDSNGAVWLPLHHITFENSSPLVLQAAEWIQTRTIKASSRLFDYRNLFEK